ncbi:MAG: radical SAM protein [Elusimicrobia bacterium]|nr:radical SAM protein [Elusimicrobiota bacterium]
MAAPPRFVRVELVGHCDPGCSGCAAPFPQPAETPALMDWAFYARLLDELASLEGLRLEGTGEPMCHPRFFDAVALAARREIAVTVSTGLAACGTRELERLASCGVSRLEVQLDGATRETYEALRAPRRFSRVLRNLVQLRRIKERLGAVRPTVVLALTTVRENLAELAALVRLARRLGVARVAVRNVPHDFSESRLPKAYAAARDWTGAQSVSTEDPDRVRRHVSRALEASRECGVELRLPGRGVAGRCRQPWDGLAVSWRGRAMPCGLIAVPERAPLGDAAVDGVFHVWNGLAFGEFRDALASPAPPDVCRGCALYKGRF